MSWDIKGKDNQTKATVDALEYNGEWMGEVYVSVTVESPAPIDFAIGDYLTYRGERFEINYDPGKIKSAPRFAKGDAFKYENIKFNSLADELTRCDFLDVAFGDNNLHFTGLPKFTFYGGVKDLANRIQANLNRAYPGEWTVTVSPEYKSTTELNVSVDKQKVWDALSILVNDFETYFTIKGRTITIGAAGVPAAHLFKYGKGNGLYEIEQTAETDQAIVTRLRAYGSTRNLPHRYYNSLSGADGKKLIPDNMAVQNLMLPSFPYTTQDPYIDSANKAALGIREGTIFFDGSQDGLEEIYPSIEGMTAEQLIVAGVPCNSTGALDEIVSAEQMTDNGVGEIDEGETQTTATPPTFKVTVKDLGFDINDHLTTETATVSFKAGMLGGREFEIVERKAIKDSADKVTGYEIELNRVYDDGIKLWFPYSAYNAKPGDKFVLLHISMPEVYVKAAAQRLLEAAKEWLSKNDYSRSVYAPKVDEIFMARQHDAAMASGGAITSLHDTLCAGMMLLFEDEDLNIDASIFIDRLTIKEGDGSIPTYEVVLKEEKTVGRLDKMQNQIDSLSSGKGQGSGGYTAAQIRALIESYGGQKFLSKIKDDEASGRIIFGKGFQTPGFIRSLIAGHGAGMDPLGNFEVESIRVRSSMTVQELIVNRQTARDSDTIFTEGDTIEAVTDNGDGTLTLRLRQEYEGYFTALTPGTVLRGMVNNLGAAANAGVPGYYYTSWMRVNSVNAPANKIEVSLYPDNETPAQKNWPPCELMKVIRWGHQTDKERQSLFIMASTEGKLYKLFGVDRPIVNFSNWELSVGTLPEAITGTDGTDGLVYGLKPGTSGIYTKVLVVEQIHQLDHQGKPVAQIIDTGPYDPAKKYYSGDRVNPETGVWEQHDVWHSGCRWRCLRTQIPGATDADKKDATDNLTPEEPKWNSTAWAMIEGNREFTVGFEETDFIFDIDSFKTTLTIVARVGNMIVTPDILDSDVAWTRYSEDADGNPRTASDNLWASQRGGSGKRISLDATDCGFYGYVPKTLTFTATVTLRDGMGNEATEAASFTYNQ